MKKVVLCLGLLFSAFTASNLEACEYCCHHSRTIIVERPQPVYYTPEVIFVETRPCRPVHYVRPARTRAAISFTFGL
ncbi:MAG: hypothetical protein KDK62_01020 [Chlamydiia bacterium]|nr:hypothetical protein [Chlamydiia bacterium]